jgi:hypothetical protein
MSALTRAELVKRLRNIGVTSADAAADMLEADATALTECAQVFLARGHESLSAEFSRRQTIAFEALSAARERKGETS